MKNRMGDGLLISIREPGCESHSMFRSGDLSRHRFVPAVQLRCCRWVGVSSGGDRWPGRSAGLSARLNWGSRSWLPRCRLNSTGLNSTGLNSTGLNSTGLNSTGLTRSRWNCTGFTWHAAPCGCLLCGRSFGLLAAFLHAFAVRARNPDELENEVHATHF